MAWYFVLIVVAWLRIRTTENVSRMNQNNKKKVQRKKAVANDLLLEQSRTMTCIKGEEAASVAVVVHR